MSMQTTPQEDQSQQGGLHPLVYKAIVALAAWLVLSIWIFFDRGNTYLGLAFVMITFFFAMLTGIPLALLHEWRRYTPQAESRGESFRDWESREIPTWTERIPGRDVVIQIMLPLAAVVVGMTLFGLVFNLVATYSA